MKNLRIFALLVASIIASHSYGAAHITLAIPPLAGFAVGAMDLMKNQVAAKVLTGMAASTPSLVTKVWGELNDLEHQYNMTGIVADSHASHRSLIQQAKKDRLFFRIPHFCGWFGGSMMAYMMAYGAGIGAGMIATAVKTKIMR